MNISRSLREGKPVTAAAIFLSPRSHVTVMQNPDLWMNPVFIPFTPGQPAADGMAEAVSQAIEKSNVFFIGETVDAMEVQRAMSASLTAVKIASQQIQNIIQQLGS